MRKLSIFFTTLLILVTGISSAWAHVEEQVGPYTIEIGWADEPPIIGYINFITFKITEEGSSEGVESGVTNAFKNLDVTITFGGLSKTLDIATDPRPGHYFSKIIPTKTGSTIIHFDGEINGVPVELTLHPEAVENTAILGFPPPSASSSDQEVVVLKNAVSSIQKDVTELKSNVGDFDISSSSVSSDTAYNFGVFGLSLGAAGVILAIIAMIKRK